MAVLGTAMEALVAIGSADAMVLARKLATYAQLHISAVPIEYFQRIIVALGRRGDAAAVLQWEHLAHTHHPQSTNATLLGARLLACASLGRHDDVQACWAALRAMGPVPYALHACCIAFWAQQGDLAALQEALRGMHQDGYEMHTSTWLDVLQSYPPLTHFVQHVRAPWEDLPLPTMLAQLAPAMLAPHIARHVPFVLRVAHVPGSEALPGPSSPEEAAWLHVWDAVAPVPASASVLAVATTWCGRRGLADTALAFCDAVMTAEPESPQAREHACIGAIQALTRADEPYAALALAQHLLPLQLGQCAEPPASVAPAVAARQAAWQHWPAQSVKLRHTIAEPLLECAGALWSVPLVHAILAEVQRAGLRWHARLRHALARLLMRCVDEHAKEMRQFVAALVATRSQAEGPVQVARWQKLQEDLDDLGFDDHIQLAQLASDRRRRSAGARRSAPQRVAPEAQMLGWVRDTALLPCHDTADGDGDGPSPAAPPPAPEAAAARPAQARAETTAPPATAPPTTATWPRTPAAYTARLQRLVRLGDTEGVQVVFRHMLECDGVPRATHVEALVQALCREQRPHEAAYVVHTAKEQWAVPPTLAMYTSLAGAYMQMGDARAARREIRAMRQHGLEPDGQLYDTMAAAAAASPSPHEPAGQTRVRDGPVDVTHLASVALRFQLLMHGHMYLEAQQFYAQCLERGMVPDYGVRRMLKRSGHWLRRRCYSDAKTAAALALWESNDKASRAAYQAAQHRDLRAQRAFRRALLPVLARAIAGRISWNDTVVL